MAEKKSFNMYKSWSPMIKAMDTMQAGLLFQAIYEYQETGEEPPKGASIYPIFCLIRAKFEEDDAAYEAKCQKSKESISKRYERIRTYTDENERIPDTDTDTDTDTVTETDTEKKENTRARKPADPKHAHGEHGKVMLTDGELEKLNAEYGEPETLDAIAWFDSYIAEKGYKSKSHYLAMRRWVYGAVAERKAKIPRERSGTFNASEYLRRKIEEAENDERGSMETGNSS